MDPNVVRTRTATVNGIEPGGDRGRRPGLAAGDPVARLPGGRLLLAPPAGAAGRSRLPRHRARSAGLRALLGPGRGRGLPGRPPGRRPARAARRDRPRAGRVRRPRLGCADRLGPGPAAPRAGAGGGRRERAARAMARCPDRDDAGGLRRPLLLHPLLPAGRAGRGRAGAGSPAHHGSGAVRGQRRRLRWPAGRAPARRRHRLPRPHVRSARAVARLAHLGRHRPLRRRASGPAASSARCRTTGTSTPTTRW